MSADPMTPLSGSLRDALATRAERDGPRVECVVIDGQDFWIKRPEALSLRMRLQKGDPSAAFKTEVATHKSLSDQGLPVAPVILATDRYLVTRGCGAPIRGLARHGSDDFEPALREAGRSLATLHKAGAVHGRPSLKDICWKDQKIAFLDFERAGRGSPAQDLQIILFSTAVETAGDLGALTLVRDAYLEVGDVAVWQACRRASRRLSWLGALLRPVSWVLRTNREFAAIAPFFHFMKDTA